MRWPALVVAVVTTVGACAGRDAAPSLSAAVRVPPAQVGGESLPEPANGGAPFRFTARPGGLLLVYFGYTSCPDVCPTTLAVLRTALRKIGKRAERVELAMVTIDPGRDTPDRLGAYVTSFVPGAHALRTDDADALRRVAEAFGASYSVATDPSGLTEVSHTPFVYIVNDRGELLAQWPFGVQAPDVAHDLSVLLSPRFRKET